MISQKTLMCLFLTALCLFSGESPAATFKGYRQIPKQRIFIVEDSLQTVIEGDHVYWIGLRQKQRFFIFPKPKDSKSLKQYLRAREKSQKPIRIAIDPASGKIAFMGDQSKKR